MNGLSEYIEEYLYDNDYDLEAAQRIVADYGTGYEALKRLRDYVREEILDIGSLDVLASLLLEEVMKVEIEWYGILNELEKDNPFIEEEYDEQLKEVHIGPFVIMSYLDGDGDWATTASRDGQKLYTDYFSSKRFNQAEAVDAVADWVGAYHEAKQESTESLEAASDILDNARKEQ